MLLIGLCCFRRVMQRSCGPRNSYIRCVCAWGRARAPVRSHVRLEGDGVFA